MEEEFKRLYEEEMAWRKQSGNRRRKWGKELLGAFEQIKRIGKKYKHFENLGVSEQHYNSLRNRVLKNARNKGIPFKKLSLGVKKQAEKALKLRLASGAEVSGFVDLEELISCVQRL